MCRAWRRAGSGPPPPTGRPSTARRTSARSSATMADSSGPASKSSASTGSSTHLRLWTARQHSRWTTRRSHGQTTSDWRCPRSGRPATGPLATTSSARVGSPVTRTARARIRGSRGGTASSKAAVAVTSLPLTAPMRPGRPASYWRGRSAIPSESVPFDAPERPGATDCRRLFRGQVAAGRRPGERVVVLMHSSWAKGNTAYFGVAERPPRPAAVGARGGLDGFSGNAFGPMMVTFHRAAGDRRGALSKRHCPLPTTRSATSPCGVWKKSPQHAAVASLMRRPVSAKNRHNNAAVGLPPAAAVGDATQFLRRAPAMLGVARHALALHAFRRIDGEIAQAVGEAEEASEDRHDLALGRRLAGATEPSPLEITLQVPESHLAERLGDERAESHQLTAVTVGRPRGALRLRVQEHGGHSLVVRAPPVCAGSIRRGGCRQRFRRHDLGASPGQQSGSGCYRGSASANSRTRSCSVCSLGTARARNSACTASTSAGCKSSVPHRRQRHAGTPVTSTRAPSRPQRPSISIRTRSISPPQLQLTLRASFA